MSLVTDCTVLLDADLQHPPFVLVEMYKKM